VERGAHLRMILTTDCSEGLGSNTSVWPFFVGDDDQSDSSHGPSCQQTTALKSIVLSS
jgi:hypothetical protein